MAVNQSLAEMSNTAVLTSMAIYAGAMVAFAIDLAGTREPVAAAAGSGQADHDRDPRVGRRKAGGIAVALTVLAVVIHGGGVVARGLSVMRVPWANMYEFAITGSLAFVVAYLITLRWRDLRALGVFITGTALLVLGLALVVLYTDASELVPALRSYWIVIHVSVAFIACAILSLSFTTALLQLIQMRRARQQAAVAKKGKEPTSSGWAHRVMERVPAADALERLTSRFIMIAFPLWTFTLVAGAIWAQKAWGRYWGWDPKEVWTFVIWVVYAAYLHARLTRGWDGKRAAVLAIVGFVCVIVNFAVVNVFFGGNHSYASIG